MLRRLVMACVGMVLTAAPAALAQGPLSSGAIPSRPALRRVGLDLHWSSMVPLQGAERLTSVSIDSGMLFAQTNLANFYAFDAESGRQLWAMHLGRVTTRAFPASVNSKAVFVSNSNHLFALDRRTGRQLWQRTLQANPSSPTACNDKRVVVGLESGMLAGFQADTGKPDWFFSTDKPVSSKPELTERVIAVGSQDGRVLVSRSERYQLLYRFVSSGPIVAPLAGHEIRTLLIPSTDHSLYAVDLFTGVEKWSFPSGAAIEQEPLVADQDVYVVNTSGQLSAVDAKSGSPRWTVPTLGGRLLAVTPTKVYLESHDEDLFVVDRATGKTIFDPQATFHRSGINLRDFGMGPTNRTNDRMYFGTKGGLLICLREQGLVQPRPLRDPSSKPFGFIPEEGYQDLVNPVAPGATPAPAAAPATEPPANP